MLFDPNDWYWIVGTDTDRVYSSKAGTYVSVGALSYKDFLNAGGIATRIASEEELGDTLAPYNLRPEVGGILEGFQSFHARATLLSAAGKILFNHENRLRAIERALNLNGSPPNITGAQALAAIKSLM